MFLWHHYFLTGFAHLVVMVIYDIVVDGNIFEDEPTAWITIPFLWWIFDAVVIGLTIKEIKNKLKRK